MEEVIQEPDIRLTGVFLEGNGITINDLDGVADHLAYTLAMGYLAMPRRLFSISASN